MIIDVAGNQIEVPDSATDADIARIIKKNALNIKPAKSVYETQAQEQSKSPFGVSNFLPAVGGAMTSAYLGGKQMLMQGADMFDSGKRAEAMIPDIQENRAAMQGLTSTKMGMAGDVVGNVAMALPTMLNPAAATIRGAAIIGGATGALRPTLDNESRLENMGEGAALGAGGAWAGNKILGALTGSRGTTAMGGNATASSTGGTASTSTTVSGGANVRGTGGGYNFGTVGDDASAGLTSAQRQLIERNPEFRLTPGQASGSRALQQMEAKLESQPMTSGTFNQIKDQNQRLVNRRVSESIGVRGSDVVDSAVLDQAHQRVDRVYGMVRNTRDRNIDPDVFINWLGDIEERSNGLLFTNGKPYSVMDHPLVSQMYNYAQNGTASARQLVDLSSKMGKAARGQMTGVSGDRQLGMALNEVKDVVDDLIETGLSGRTQRLFGEARGNYRNLMTLESRVGIVNPSNGNVSGATLANTLQQKDKSGFLLGRNQTPMYDAARLAQAFKPIVGDSGTATRSALPSPTDFVLSLPFNLATRAYTSAPVVNLAARGGQISRNGLMPQIDPNDLKYLPQLGTAAGIGAGGLLSIP
jgi:hypothetical protein